MDESLIIFQNGTIKNNENGSAVVMNPRNRIINSIQHKVGSANLLQNIVCNRFCPSLGHSVL